MTDQIPDWTDRDYVSACGCNEARNRTCFYHKLKTIQFAGRGKSPQSMMERQWEKDRPAYYRLRMEGLQPKSIKGCAELEKHANSQTEVEMGHLFPKDVLPKVEEGMAIAKDIGWTPKEDADSVADAKKRRQEART